MLFDTNENLQYIFYFIKLGLQQYITHKTREKKRMEFSHFRVFRGQIEIPIHQIISVDGYLSTYLFNRMKIFPRYSNTSIMERIAMSVGTGRKIETI